MRHLLPVLLLVGACKKDPTEPSTTDSADPTGTGDIGDTGPTAASTVRWLNIGGGLGEGEWVTSIAVAPGGPVAAVAQTQPVATWWPDTDDEVRLTAEGDNDGVLPLVDPDTGALENLVHFGGPGTVVAEAVAASSDRLAVVFAYDGETTLDGTELAPAGAKGRLLMLFDHEGGLQWSRRIDSDFIVAFWGQVAFDASGGLLLGLSTIGDVVVDPGGQALLATGAGATDSTVARFDLDGAADWVRLVGNGGDQYYGSTLAMPDGGYVLTGGFANALTVGTKAPVSVTAPVGSRCRPRGGPASTPSSTPTAPSSPAGSAPTAPSPSHGLGQPLGAGRPPRRGGGGGRPGRRRVGERGNADGLGCGRHLAVWAPDGSSSEEPGGCCSTAPGPFGAPWLVLLAPLVASRRRPTALPRSAARR